jgi:hypothetical protein
VNNPKVFENPCALCRVKEATQLCDFVVDYYWMSHVGNSTFTCDLPMCKECSQEYSNHDFCPEHFKMLPDLRLKDKKLTSAISKNHARLLK